MWHVMQNCRKHVGMVCDWGEKARKLREILHDSWSITEFEEAWKQWESQFVGKPKKWLEEMFSKRTKWVPIYFKNEFWAGMSSTQRSEGLNHYLKGFVNINTTLTEFVEEYAKAVCKRIEEENKGRVVGLDLTSKCGVRHPFQADFEELYTSEKFAEFYDEVLDMANNTASIKQQSDDGVVEYDVCVKSFRPGWTRRRNFSVVMKRSMNEVTCCCRNFEFRGILCSHALRVFWIEEVFKVPDRYIVAWWRKDLPRKYMKESYPMAAITPPISEERKRYEETNQICQEICVMVMNNEKLQQDAVAQLKQLHTEIKSRSENPAGISSYVIGGVGSVYRNDRKRREDMQGERESVGVEEEIPSTLVKDPVDKRGRGRGQHKRKQSYLEKPYERVRAGSTPKKFVEVQSLIVY